MDNGYITGRYQSRAKESSTAWTAPLLLGFSSD